MLSAGEEIRRVCEVDDVRAEIARFAFVMPSYYGRYGCGPDCSGNTEPVPNISSLGPKISFGCTTQAQPGIPVNEYSVIVRQDYQKSDGSLAPSAGLTFRYGDVFKWWYYEASC